MSIPVTCLQCASSCDVADDLAGKKVLCQQCDAVLEVPGEAPPAVSATAIQPDASSSREAPPKPSHSRPRGAAPVRRRGRWLALVAGGALLMVLLCGIAAVLFWRRGLFPGDWGASWQVQADPAPDSGALPDDAQGAIPVAGFFHPVVFPTTPSPFVCISGGSGFNKTSEVWDLRSVRRIGAVPVGDSMGAVVLSPDGAYVAVAAVAEPAVNIFSVAGGRNARITLDNRTMSVETLDFAGPGQLLTAQAVGSDTLFQVWDVATSVELRRFQAPAEVDHRPMAFSAGRRYLALWGRTDDRVLIYDLTTGRQAGVLLAPQTLFCEGLAFSWDGRSIAALFGFDRDAHLRVWDTAAGRQTADFPLGQDPEVPQGKGMYEGPPVEMLPDGGWLLYGRLLVDGQTGAVRGRIPAGTFDRDPRRVFAGGKVAHVQDSGPKKSLVLEALRPDKGPDPR